MPRPAQGNLEGGGAQETEEQEAGADDGPTLPGVVSQAREWLWTATPMLPKVSWCAAVCGVLRWRCCAASPHEPLLHASVLWRGKTPAAPTLQQKACAPRRGWLPFGFTFLGLSTASKLLLFVTAFAVYCSALMYRLYEHTQGCDTMAALGQVRPALSAPSLLVAKRDLAGPALPPRTCSARQRAIAPVPSRPAPQEALGRFGRNLVNGFTLAINIALPVVSHVGGARFFQYALFPGTGVCLPWVSLLFGALVLGLGQIQRLGTLPRLATVVIPVLALGAVALTITQLLLLKAAGAGPAQEEQGLVYLSDYALAVVALISANYFGQHTFPEMIAGMEHPAHFPHATATAQVGRGAWPAPAACCPTGARPERCARPACGSSPRLLRSLACAVQVLTLMLNAAVGLASFHVPSMHVHGFISFASNSNELLPRLAACSVAAGAVVWGRGDMPEKWGLLVWRLLVCAAVQQMWRTGALPAG